MKKYILFLSLILIVACVSCNRDNAIRDKILFNDNIRSVQDSLIKIAFLLDKLQDPRSINRNYTNNFETLTINNEQINSNTNLDTVKALSNFSKSEKKEFINLINYLKRNDITSGSFDTYLGLWLFDYKYLPEGSNKDTRVVGILSKNDISRNRLLVKIFDHKGSIYLLGFNRD